MVFAALALVGTVAWGQSPSYPTTRKVEQVDNYHGTPVSDPYRWLEDDNSPETAKWVEAQNRVTFDYLEKIPFRGQLKQRLEQLYNYPKFGSPSRKGEYYLFSKNDGLQNQNVLYIQKGLSGTPEVLLDPNRWSTDGTVRLSAFALSKDGKYAAIGVSRSGSDWQEYQVMEVSTRRMLADAVKWVKVSSPAWSGNGFFYSRYPEPKKGYELSTRNEDHQVWYHRVGSAQSEDQLVYSDPTNPQRFHLIQTTEDEHFAILTISDRGKGKKGNSILYRDLAKGEKQFHPIVAEIGDDSYSVVDNIGEKFLVETNHRAPNGRVVLFDPAKPGEWQEVLPEKPEPLESVTTAGGKLFATYLKDVTTKAFVYTLSGKLENEVSLPGPGSAGGFGGN
ncbi:MAG: S9 family peptidase, partial [Acidobacteria bacterium]|nr:S9 family peptidase [Acidobacteriota bacterium]